MAIGQRVPMIDAVERVTGSIPYTLNVEIPGMLVGRILGSTYPHARLTRVDVSAAERAPGVVAVVCRDDLTDATILDPYFGPLVRDQPIVALETVRYAGEAVAAVAAVDEEAAARALELIEVEYEELPGVFDVEAALVADAPKLHGQSNAGERFEVRRGDVEQGFRDADFVFEDEYRCPPVQHVSLEPHLSIAQLEAGKLTVWTSSQTPFVVRAQLAEIFKLPQSQVRVIVHTLGGGFGGKCYPKLEPITALLAWKAGRPVKIVLDRAEDFLASRRSSALIREKTGVMRDGRLVARQTRCYYDKGAYTETGPRVVRTGGLASTACYRVPNVHLESFSVFTNLPPSGPFRAPGAAQAIWASECHLDAIARRLRLDPLELRRKNLVHDGDRYIGGGELDELHFDELLALAERAIEWTEDGSKTTGRRGDEATSGSGQREEGSGKWRRGKAIAVGLKTSRTPSTSTASCKLNEDGSLSVLTSSVEMGQGAKTALAQIAAEASGVPLGEVSISEPDTDLTPYDATTSSSRTTYMMGTAIRLAGEDVRQQVAGLAASELEVAADDLLLLDGRASVRGAAERALTYGELLRRSKRGNLLGSGSFTSQAKPDPVTGEPGISAHWHHAVGAAEVEVDIETGRVRPVRLHAGVFVGRIINPQQCELQTEGSLTFALGQGLLEQMAFDSGRLTNPNLADYMVPSFKDLPANLSVSVLEETGSESIHGIGETALPPILAAIASATADAIGIELRELPITPERVLRALQGRQDGPP